MGRGRRRWRASERIAYKVLVEQGYDILDVHRKIVIDGVEVSEVDAIAKGPDGEVYAVEVKAGRIDLQAIRQAYSNAVLIGAKPLIVGKGFADDAARAAAERLGIKVIELEDMFIVDPEELEEVVETALVNALVGVLRLLFDPAITVKPDSIDAIKALASSDSPVDAAKKLGVQVKDVVNIIRWLREISPLARTGWDGVKLTANLLLLRLYAEAKIDTITRSSELLSSIFSLEGKRR